MKNFSIYIWTASLLGLFSGGSIIVLFILIPIWQTLQPSELMDWFGKFGGRIGFTMLPMEMIPLLLSVYSFFISKKSNDAGKKLWAGVVLCNLIVLAMLFIYFIPVNMSFINKTIDPGNVATELKKWKMIHIARTILIVLSMVLAILATKNFLKKISTPA